jgi:ATP-dependent Clp protease adapter protein ClpS
MLHILIEDYNTEQKRPSRIRSQDSKDPNTSQCYIIHILTVLFSRMTRCLAISIGPPIVRMF